MFQPNDCARLTYRLQIGFDFGVYLRDTRGKPVLLLLKAIDGAYGREYRVARRATIGSEASNDVVVNHESVSRRHAEISRTIFGRYVLRDLRSTNGTCIKGKRVRRSQIVAGDWAINGWIQTPFHRSALLNPNLSTVGYGESCQIPFCAAALNVQAGSQRARHDFVTPRAVFFPSDKSTIPIAVSSIVNEWPNPTTSCPGFRFPTGVAITVQLGGDFDARLGDFSVLSEGRQVPACGFDSNSYKNSNEVELQRVREVLKGYGLVVIIVRDPPSPGAQYDVSVTVNENPYRWSFTIGN